MSEWHNIFAQMRHLLIHDGCVKALTLHFEIHRLRKYDVPRRAQFTSSPKKIELEVAGQTLVCYCVCCELLSASKADALQFVNMVCLPLIAEQNAHEICLTKECLQIVRHLLWKQTTGTIHSFYRFRSTFAFVIGSTIASSKIVSSTLKWVNIINIYNM